MHACEDTGTGNGGDESYVRTQHVIKSIEEIEVSRTFLRDYTIFDQSLYRR